MLIHAAFIAALALPASARASEPSEGTHTVSPSSAALSDCIASGETPFILALRHDERGTRVALDYTLRWDLADLMRLPTRTREVILSPMGGLREVSCGLTRGASIGVYGLRIRPTRIFVFETGEQGPRKAAAGGQQGGANGNGGESRRRLRLSLTPVIDDIRRDLRSAIRRQIIASGFDAAVPEARNASFAQKEAVVEDAILAGESFGLRSKGLQPPLWEPLMDAVEGKPKSKR
ncbi:MAG: hypothetical protein ABII00_08635 [Elusimicrobiota bacterium]